MSFYYDTKNKRKKNFKIKRKIYFKSIKEQYIINRYNKIEIIYKEKSYGTTQKSKLKGTPKFTKVDSAQLMKQAMVKHF